MNDQSPNQTTPPPADGPLFEQVARAIAIARGMTSFIKDDIWASQLAHTREMTEKYGRAYTDGREVTLDALRDARAALAAIRFEGLFDAIKHGDEEHQAWLREAIDAHVTGRPVPAPRGHGNKERLLADNARLVRRVKVLESHPSDCTCQNCEAFSALEAREQAEAYPA